MRHLILAICNSGNADDVMNTAKNAGARGGTIINARGTASKEAEKIFNITIQPEKEIVMILIPSKLKNNILQGLYASIGTSTPAQGIAFSLPVDDVAGVGKELPKIEN